MKTAYLVPRILRPLAANPWLSFGLAISILALDLFTEPLLQFPILFLLPVIFTAWFGKPILAQFYAVMLPIGSLIIAKFVEQSLPWTTASINCLVRIAVLVLIAYLVHCSSNHQRELEERANTLVKMCAWSRTIEYNGQWISFEEYLKQRFNIHTSHGISPQQLQRVLPKQAPDKPNETSKSDTNERVS